MRFGDSCVFLGTVPRPMDGIGRDTLKISFLAVKTLFFDEEPDFAFQDVVDLLRFMFVRFGMIPGRSDRDHQTAFVSIAFFYDHRAGARLSGLNTLRLRHLTTFRM